MRRKPSLIVNRLERFLGKKRIEINKDLFPYLTLHTNTVAEFFFEAKTRDDLIKAKAISLKLNLPLVVLGGGSNIAIIKEKVKGLVIKNSYKNYEILREEKNFVEILVSSGYRVSELISKTVGHGFEGFEYHKGLAGTVGGAIYMNSKWTRPVSYFGDKLIYGYIINNKGRVEKVNRDYFRFNYGYSFLQETKELLLEAVFKLKKENPKILKSRATRSFEYRRQTQPLGEASSGCFFKNISEHERARLQLPTTSVGYLIDKVGLKGYRVGNFTVSKLHANFIINKGEKRQGKTDDLLKLLKIIKERVREKFGVRLKEEVVII